MKKILCVLFMALAITECSKGVKQEVYDALLTENVLLEQSNEELTTKASTLQKTIDSFESNALKKEKKNCLKFMIFQSLRLKPITKVRFCKFGTLLTLTQLIIMIQLLEHSVLKLVNCHIRIGSTMTQ